MPTGKSHKKKAWSMNDSMKRNEYIDCQYLEDAYHSKDKVATIVYSEDFKKMCPGGSDELTTCDLTCDPDERGFSYLI